jgi:predicted helicase
MNKKERDKLEKSLASYFKEIHKIYTDGDSIHRGMRKKLLETFDEICILNLHGSSRIGGKTPEGGKDENVFDIQQGVAIALFVKFGEK